jgi:hypothetical protein
MTLSLGDNGWVKLSKGNAKNEQNFNHDRGSGGPTDPLIQALIHKHPEEGPWPADDRVKWLKMLPMAFQITYG